MKNVFLSTICVFALIGCGGGGSSDNSDNNKGFKYTADGYPIVDGEYTVKLEPYTLKCSDGETMKQDSETIEWKIVSEGNKLNIKTNTGSNQIITITEEKDNGTYLQKDATFKGIKMRYGYVQKTSGGYFDISGILNRNGTFTSNEIKGKNNMTFTIVGEYTSTTCKGIQKFKGKKTTIKKNFIL